MTLYAGDCRLHQVDIQNQEAEATFFPGYFPAALGQSPVAVQPPSCGHYFLLGAPPDSGASFLSELASLPWLVPG